MKLKHVTLCFFIILLFAAITHVKAEETRQSSAPERLLDMISVLKKEEIPIRNWSVYVKKKGSFLSHQKGYEKISDAIRHYLPDFHWVINESESQLTLTGIRRIPHLAIKERLTFIGYRHGGRIGTYYIYEVEGNGWDPVQWEAFSADFRKRILIFFKQNATIFTCVQGVLDGKMNFVLYKKARDLLHLFHADPVEGVREKTFVSLSAYTDDWEASIPTNNKRMNLQVALRLAPDGNGATVTIGTPIITSEY